MRNLIKKLPVLLCLLLVSACAAKRPVLYPNSQLKEIGQTKANQEIDDCISLANEYQAGGSKSKEIAKDAGKAGIVGAATGAVIGVFTGDFGRAVAIGGAGAATATAGMGVMHSDEPDQLFRQFVEQCLREKGYQPVGWK